METAGLKRFPVPASHANGEVIPLCGSCVYVKFSKLCKITASLKTAWCLVPLEQVWPDSHVTHTNLA